MSASSGLVFAPSGIMQNCCQRLLQVAVWYRDRNLRRVRSPCFLVVAEVSWASSEVVSWAEADFSGAVFSGSATNTPIC